ncbi:hypothetical protein ON010_g19151 [Phytophthora cinnamomi]|nr:hypothetical protein ON010_g19151 [Phytophthora cinnamomi]
MLGDCLLRWLILSRSDDEYRGEDSIPHSIHRGYDFPGILRVVNHFISSSGWQGFYRRRRGGLGTNDPIHQVHFLPGSSDHRIPGVSSAVLHCCRSTSRAARSPNVATHKVADQESAFAHDVAQGGPDA